MYHIIMLRIYGCNWRRHIKDFSKLLNIVASSAPLRRNVTIDDVGNTAAFLLSNLANGITGEIIYVDCGFSHIAIDTGST
jgi:enoyl-[acyl-carrier protein] reductase I